MYFTDLHQKKKSNPAGIALVVALHAALGYGLYKSMQFAHILPQAKEIEVVLTPEKEQIKPPPPPPPPEQPKQQAAPDIPNVIVPEVKTEAPPPDITVAKVEVMPSVTPTTLSGPAVPDVAPAQADSGPMKTAVLADACATPAYPAQALRNGETGTTVLALLVGPNGRVQDAKVSKTSGHKDLDKAARNALSLCRFKPATEGGQAVAAWGAISYTWSIND